MPQGDGKAPGSPEGSGDPQAGARPERQQQTTSVPRLDAPSSDTGPAAPEPVDATRGSAAQALPSATPPSRAGRTFAPAELVAGRYEIVRFIAQGGMGEVYEATDRDLGERLALKTVRPELAAQDAIFARFKREIHLARKVTHPNVCRIFDLGHHRPPGGDPVSFLTMELLEGETLSQRIKRGGRLTPEQALPIVRQMASALATAHEAGMVHRDFKSSNVMLVPARQGERAVVTDFGLARGALDSGSLEASLTGTGDMVGTPAYMAPEQIEGKPLTGAADLYALGVVMFEMVTGAWPFNADTPIAIAMKHLKDQPVSPRSLVKNLDPCWEVAILRCLERDPADRFANANDVVKALAGEEVAPSLRRARLTRSRVAGSVAAGLLVAFGLGYALLRNPGVSTPVPVAAPPSAAPAPIKARRSLAVLGFKNLGRPEAAWLSTAMSEMLRTELAAGEKVRSIPGENVARMRLELKLAESDSLARDTLARIRSNIGADLVLVGAYLVAGKGGKIRLDARLQDTASGELLGSAAATGTEDEVFALVSQAGAELRGKLGLSAVSAADAEAVRATLPANMQAARLYAEGIEKLRVFDALAARDLLQKAAAADPRHPLVRSALAAAWEALGYDEKAKQEAQKAFELSQGLPREERLSVEGLLRETTGDWDKAVGLYRGLSVFFPDNLEYGLRLATAQTSAGRGEEALATIASLRRLPPPASDDPRIDLAEAAAAKALTQFEKQRKAAVAAAAKAQARGAQLLVAQAKLMEGKALVDLGRLDPAKAACEDARRIFAEAGDLAGAARAENMTAVALANADDLEGARATMQRALEKLRAIGNARETAVLLLNIGNLLDMQGKSADARKSFDEGLRIAREVGDRTTAARILNNLALLLENVGDLEAARRAYEEALRAFEEIGETRNAGLALANVGEVLHKQGRLDEAAKKYEEALKINRQAGTRVDVAGTLVLLGKLRGERKDVPGARQALEEAAQIYKAAGLAQEEAEVRKRLTELAGGVSGAGSKGGPDGS